MNVLIRWLLNDVFNQTFLVFQREFFTFSNIIRTAILNKAFFQSHLSLIDKVQLTERKPTLQETTKQEPLTSAWFSPRDKDQYKDITQCLAHYLRVMVVGRSPANYIGLLQYALFIDNNTFLLFFLLQ